MSRLLRSPRPRATGGWSCWYWQRRSAPIPRSLVDDLAVHLAGKRPDELVFTSTRGAVLRNLSFRRDVFDRAARTAGLDGLTRTS